MRFLRTAPAVRFFTYKEMFKMKKAISLVLSIVMLITMMSVGFSAYADAPKTFYVYSAVGDYEENVFEDVDAAYWEEQYGIANYFDSKDGTLYIYGKNKIPNHYLSPDMYFNPDCGTGYKLHYKLNEEHIDFMRENVKSIVICEGITGIGVAAFSDIFENVESVYIPSTVKIIEFEAFARMKKLTSLYIAEGVERIISKAFVDCDSLTEVTLPRSLKALAESTDAEIRFLDEYWATYDFDYVSPFTNCDSLSKIECLSENAEFSYIASNCKSLKTIVVAKPVHGVLVSGNCSLKDVYLLSKECGNEYVRPVVQSIEYDKTEIYGSGNGKTTTFEHEYGCYKNATIHCYRDSDIYQIYSHITKNIKLLDAPKVTGLKVSKSTTYSITLTWNKGTNATAYEVQRYMNQTKVWKTVATTTKTSCTVKDLYPCDTYKFRVRAVNKTNYTNEKGEYCGTVKATTKMNPVTVTATAKSGKITVKYNKSSNATDYEIYIKSGKNGKYKKLTTTSKKSYTTKKMKKGTYYIKVRARKKVSKGKYNYSAYSKEVKVKL